ncbi:MAG TPA: hypothetical protein VM285_13390, partial [Polyangia bacterium]|nr:hypothetical protein [Polyangia bacterium]
MVITTLAALTGAIAFLALREPSYEATANVLVTALPQDDQTFLGLSLLRDSGDSTRTTQTAATLLDSPEAARLAASELGPDWTQQRVEDSVDVSPQGDSNIIAITGAANNPGLSTQVADEFTAAALEVRAKGLEQQVDDAIKLTSTELDKTAKKDPNAFELSARLTQLRSIQDTGDPTLTFQQQATIPTSPTNPGPVIVIPLALIAGFALGSGAALMRELLDRRIVDVEDAIAIYPLPVLARVPRLPKREGDHPPGASWHMAPEAMEALRTLILQFEQRERPLGTVLITSPTRGDGKTTSSINLATMLAATGRQVVLLDFDL